MRAWRLAALLVSISAVASPADIAGIKLDERARIGACELVLNGAGLRRRAVFKVYVAGLYLTERRSSSADVYALAGPKRARITLMRNLPARDLVDALRNGIRDNSSPAEQQALKGRIEELAANLLAVRQGNKGDVIAIDWVPGVGTLVVLNGETTGGAIPGNDLYRAVLGVWLGDRPTSAGLKKALLGQSD